MNNNNNKKSDAGAVVSISDVSSPHVTDDATNIPTQAVVSALLAQYEEPKRKGKKRSKSSSSKMCSIL